MQQHHSAFLIFIFQTLTQFLLRKLNVLYLNTMGLVIIVKGKALETCITVLKQHNNYIKNNHCSTFVY